MLERQQQSTLTSLHLVKAINDRVYLVLEQLNLILRQRELQARQQQQLQQHQETIRCHVTPWPPNYWPTSNHMQYLY